MKSRIKKLPAALAALASLVTSGVRRELFRASLERRFPGVHLGWPIQFTLDIPAALEIGTGSFIGPFSEIVVLEKSPCSTVPGRLIIGCGVRIGIGANLRAAGGVIRIGDRTQIGQHVSIIASNHYVGADEQGAQPDRWDETRTGVTIGEDCWIGAGAVLLPGVTLGCGAVVGAGSVVTKSIGEKQTWYGNPARASSPRPA